MSHGTHEPPPLLFPLLDLPCGPLALVYANLDAPMRHALMQTSKAARARCSLSSEATFVARCSAETAYFSRKRSSLVNPSAAAAAAAAAASSSHSHSQQQQQQEAGLLQGAALPGVHKARMVHDMARLPRTSIERFFKHSAARHLLATSRAALKHAPTRQLMAGVTHLTLQVSAWVAPRRGRPMCGSALQGTGNAWVRPPSRAASLSPQWAGPSPEARLFLTHLDDQRARPAP